MRKPSADVVPWPRMPSDALLVSELRARRSSAASALFSAYSAYVRKVVVRILGPDGEVDDIVQDVFAIALASLHKLQHPDALRSWLAQITVFQTRRRIRARKQWRILRFFAPAELPEARVAPFDFEASEALRATYRVLSRLDADAQVAFALRFVEGMELTEVAEACQVSLATIKRRLRKAEARFTELGQVEPALAEWIGGLK